MEFVKGANNLQRSLSFLLDIMASGTLMGCKVIGTFLERRKDPLRTNTQTDVSFYCSRMYGYTTPCVTMTYHLNE